MRAGRPVRISKKVKKIEAAKKRKNIRQKGGKTCRATFVATKDDPQKRTADARAVYVSSVCLSVIVYFDLAGIQYFRNYFLRFYTTQEGTEKSGRKSIL